MLLRSLPKNRQYFQAYDFLGTNKRFITVFGMIADGTMGINVQNIPLMAENIVADLMLLGNENKDPIQIFLNTPGGSVQAGLLIIDAIEHLQALGIDVETIAMSQSASMGTPILASGTKGKRYAFPHATIHVHDVSGGASGRIQDVKEQIGHVEHVEKQIHEILATKTKIPEYHVSLGESPETVEEFRQLEKTNPEKYFKLRIKYTREFFSKETFLTSEKALEAGIIDKILNPGNPYLNEIFKPSENGGAQ